MATQTSYVHLLILYEVIEVSIFKNYLHSRHLLKNNCLEVQLWYLC